MQFSKIHILIPSRISYYAKEIFKNAYSKPLHNVDSIIVYDNHSLSGKN